MRVFVETLSFCLVVAGSVAVGIVVAFATAMFYYAAPKRVKWQILYDLSNR